MAIKTTYICDRCKHDQPTEEQMWSVGLVYVHGACQLHYAEGYGTGGRSIHREALWCRTCMQELGILGPHAAVVNGDSTQPVPAPPILEDIVREVAREEIAATTGAVS